MAAPLDGRRLVVSNGMYESAFAIVLAAAAEGAEVHVVSSGSTGDVSSSRRVLRSHAGPAARLAHESLAANATPDPYAERMLEVAESIGADAVIGSTDDEVAALAALGYDGPIRVAVPPLETLRRLMDKGLSFRAAAEAGFAVPETRVVESFDDVAAFAADQSWPVVLKQRLSTTSRGVRIARDKAGLKTAYDELAAHPMLVQSYVPGPREPSISVMRRTDGHLPMEVTLRKQRYLHASLSTSIRAVDPLPEVAAARRYAEITGAVGFVGIQVREDPRTERHHFIESNARWGANSRMLIPLLRAHGLAPLTTFLDCWESRRPIEPAPSIRGAAVSPLEDALALRSLALLKLSRRDEPSVGAVARSYWNSYVGSRSTVTDDLFREIRHDPRAWLSAASRAIRERHADIRLIPLGDLAS